MEKLALDHAFRFTEADLSQNRQGRLSDTQAAHIRGESLQLTTAVAVALLAVIGLAYFSAQVPLADFLPPALLIIVPVVVWLAVRFIRTEALLRPGSVSQFVGDLRVIDLPYRTSGNVYYLELGEQKLRLRLTRDQVRALVPDMYTIYFLPKSFQVVSVERLGMPAPTPLPNVDDSSTVDQSERSDLPRA